MWARSSVLFQEHLIYWFQNVHEDKKLCVKNEELKARSSRIDVEHRASYMGRPNVRYYTKISLTALDYIN